jgi:hypothetical protein
VLIAPYGDDIFSFDDLRARQALQEVPGWLVDLPSASPMMLVVPPPEDHGSAKTMMILVGPVKARSKGSRRLFKHAG